MKKQEVLAKILDAAIIASMVVALAIMVAMPFLRSFYEEVVTLFDAYPMVDGRFLSYFACLKMPSFLLVTCAIYFTGILYLIIAAEARRLTRSILRKTPFAMRNVMALRRIAVLAFAECVIFSGLTLMLLLLHFSVFALMITFIIAIASVFVSIIGAVLSQLLRSAIAIKNENDLTI